MANITFFCLVEEDPAAKAFSFKNIPSSDTIDDLRKRIKAEKANDFHDIDANNLTLWRVSVPLTDDEEELPIILDTLNEKKKLRPTTRLSKVFTEEPSEEVIHIIVQLPPPEFLKRCLDNQG
ncbi:hypothetical protein BC939DRAFT_505810 [Gamsiella multidivaricata]|uniref:uncharacterized protein n=1 Tax=Gamsiella multidivaricata TaxID=101098 RepID=UPI00221E4993|nr:uncharacterized protein BC939DRAFT_505810 [Gamsiella multidivaricata]KAI7819293.1 hypothetical protein BC939DRAFT_505810 [Gamsiella multidivaricata]